MSTPQQSMTNNPRVFLWLALALALWLNYEAWNRDYHSPTSTVQSASTGKSANAPTAPGLGDAIPQATAPPAATGAPAATTNAPPAEQSGASPAAIGTIHVRTDVLDIEISLQGGTIVRADLLKYPKVKGQQEPVRLANQDSPQTMYVVQSGLFGPGGSSHPTHQAVFSSPQGEYTLQRGEKELRVPLLWKDENGIAVEKTFIFKPGEYRIDLNQTVRNGSSMPWQGATYARIFRNDPRTSTSMFNVESYAFHGPAMWDGTKYRKLDAEDQDDAKLAIDVKDGWIAALQHHFVTAIIPPKNATYKLTLGADANQYLFSAQEGTLQTVAPSQTAQFPITLFLGPKLQKQLHEIHPELSRVTDYNHLYLLAQPLFKLLSLVHGFSGNWGIAIIVVTFLLKLVFYPLSETSGRSMAKMKLLAPRIKNLQETHKDDREKLGRAMMELYQREKINPVAGCLPIIIQIPVFLAFYWVLLESVEMRQAPFMGWINDLSSRDPFFILPAIMAAAMFMQYKLQPTPADPIQAKVFMIMPLAMSVMFAFFPAGLVLYWVTNTVLSIAQQWNINRRIEAAKKT